MPGRADARRFDAKYAAVQRGQTEHSRDMSVRQRAVYGECLVEGTDDDAAFQKNADGIDDECRGFGQIGEGFAFDALAVAFGVA